MEPPSLPFWLMSLFSLVVKNFSLIQSYTFSLEHIPLLVTDFSFNSFGSLETCSLRF